MRYMPSQSRLCQCQDRRVGCGRARRRGGRVGRRWLELVARLGGRWDIAGDVVGVAEANESVGFMPVVAEIAVQG